MTEEEKLRDLLRIESLAVDNLTGAIVKAAAQRGRAEAALERIEIAASMRITDIWREKNMAPLDYIVKEIFAALAEYEKSNHEG